MIDWNEYITWINANFATDEARAFMLGLGLGIFVQMLRWGFRLLKRGGSQFL